MITIKAYAKINLFLNVVGKRADHYHDLEMINAKIDLADVLHFRETKSKDRVTLHSNDLFLEHQPNLLKKVATYMMEQYARLQQIDITIEKTIPAGAGLGGNSADAAAIIKGIDEVFHLRLSPDEMRLIGLRFGADIPYCLTQGFAKVTGIGDIIEPLNFSLDEYKVLVLKPKVFVKTEDVFNLGDVLGFEHQDIQPLLSAIKAKNILDFLANMRNGLEKITFSLSPETSEAKQLIVKELGPDGAVMSGSGSTIIKILSAKDERISSFMTKNAEKYTIFLTNIINNE